MYSQTKASSFSRSPQAEPPRSGVAVNRWGLDEGDVDLIRRLLELTPKQRLRAAQSFANSMTRLKRNARRIS